MPRVEEFSASNVGRFLLMVVIALGLILSVGYWVFYSPGRHQPAIEYSAPTDAR